jgi:hypothetical protein
MHEIQERMEITKRVLHEAASQLGKVPEGGQSKSVNQGLP